ncbi:ThiF family adenylyltransferase [Peribacillus sp. SCS-37]|uniref:ThiF family adenylyltransferase n=1 Tax=Paraperibacillus esterisolvens TaxID=3115296 RepID=UPI003906CC6D
MIKEQFIRNHGILSQEEMDKLAGTAIAIAGCGCIGGFSAELLARLGAGKIILSDPTQFDVSNINRQCAATHATVGQNKTLALKEHLLAINPGLEVSCYTEGVQMDNCEMFLEGAHYVIDAIDYFHFGDSVVLHRAARKKELFVTTAAALGFGASVLTFAPDGMTLEAYTGLPEGCTREELEGAVFPPSGYSRMLPAYATEEKVSSWLSEKSIPAISVGQALGPGMLVSQMILHILGRKQPRLVPESLQIQFEE